MIGDERWRRKDRPRSRLSADGPLFARGYGQNRKVLLVDLGSRQSKTRVPVDEQGTPIKSLHACGRGSILYLFVDAALYAIDLTELD